MRHRQLILDVLAIATIALLFTAMVAVTSMLGSCKPPAPPAPPAPGKPLVCLVGGLGNYQLGEVAKDIRQRFPDLEVREFEGKHGYLSDLRTYIKASKHTKLILITHSYGSSAVNDVINDIGNVELWVMFDPVPQQLFGTFKIPPTVKRTAIVWANASGLIRANVKYPQVEYLIRDGHSAICKTPQAYDIVEREIAWSLK